MERPKPDAHKIERALTGEILYLDMMRQRGESPLDYEELSDTEKNEYEDEAVRLQIEGLRPDIMAVYEECDPELTPLEASCRALINELIVCKDEQSDLTYVTMHIVSTPEQVRERLQSSRVGVLLASDEEQLAMPANDYWGEVDIRKRDSELDGASLTVWKWTAPNVMRDPTVPNDKYGPESILHFPSGEMQEWGQLDINLLYTHPKEGAWNETVTLYQGIGGEISLRSNIWASVYAETGYEGHGGKTGEPGEQAVTEFADMVAELVGNEPISEREYERVQFALYLNEMKLPESREYLREWVENSWTGQVLYELETLRAGDVSLREGLTIDEHADTAHAQLVAYVNAKREERNQFIAEQTKEQEQLWGSVPRWHDRVVRQAESL